MIKNKLRYYSLILGWMLSWASMNTSLITAQETAQDDLNGQVFVKKAIKLAMKLEAARRILQPYGGFGEAMADGNLRGQVGSYLVLFSMLELGDEIASLAPSNQTSAGKLTSALILATPQAILANRWFHGPSDPAFREALSEFSLSAAAGKTLQLIESLTGETKIAVALPASVLALGARYGFTPSSPSLTGSLVRSFLVSTIFSAASLGTELSQTGLLFLTTGGSLKYFKGCLRRNMRALVPPGAAEASSAANGNNGPTFIDMGAKVATQVGGMLLLLSTQDYISEHVTVNPLLHVAAYSFGAYVLNPLATRLSDSSPVAFLSQLSVSCLLIAIPLGTTIAGDLLESAM